MLHEYYDHTPGRFPVSSAIAFSICFARGAKSHCAAGCVGRRCAAKCKGRCWEDGRMKPGHGYSLLFQKKNVESFRCKVAGMMLKKCFFSKKNMEIVTILQMLLPYLAGGLEHDFYLSISYMG